MLHLRPTRWLRALTGLLAVALSLLASAAWAMECYLHWRLTLVERSDGVVTDEDADSTAADTLVWVASGPVLRSSEDVPFYGLRPFANSNTLIELEFEP